jgi:Flp pilus assembly pilin Flp
MTNQNRAKKVSENMEPRTNKTKLPVADAKRRQAMPSRNCGRASIRMLGVLRRFNSDTSGAVTVDFVVLTAAIVSMGVMAAGTISAGVGSSVAKTESCLVNTNANLAIKENLSALQKLPKTEQRCGRLLGFREVATDTVTVKLVR